MAGKSKRIQNKISAIVDARGCLPDGRCDYLSPQWLEYTGRPEAAGITK